MRPACSRWSPLLTRRPRSRQGPGPRYRIAGGEDRRRRLLRMHCRGLRRSSTAEPSAGRRVGPRPGGLAACPGGRECQLPRHMTQVLGRSSTAAIDDRAAGRAQARPALFSCARGPATLEPMDVTSYGRSSRSRRSTARRSASGRDRCRRRRATRASRRRRSPAGVRSTIAATTASQELYPGARGGVASRATAGRSAPTTAGAICRGATHKASRGRSLCGSARAAAPA